MNRVSSAQNSPRMEYCAAADSPASDLGEVAACRLVADGTNESGDLCMSDIGLVTKVHREVRYFLDIRAKIVRGDV